MSDLSSTQAEPKRRWLTGKKLIGLALAALIVLRIGVELIPTRVQIGPETTFIEGPLRDDGTVDYAAALNEEWSEGVTPENNAAVALLEAIDPGIISEEIREAYYEQLGVPIPPMEGNHLIDVRSFIQSQGLDGQQDAERTAELEGQFYDALSRPWSAEEFPEVAGWLDANQIPLQQIVVASHRPRYFSPLIPPEDTGLFNALMSLEQESRSAVRLLMAQAMLELGRGNLDRAFDLTLACHRLARLISEHPTLIGSMISVALDAIATEGDAAIVLDERLTAEQAATFRQRLQALSQPRSLANVFDRGERFRGLDTVQALHAGGVQELHAGGVQDEDLETIPVILGFDPNPTLRRFNDFYDKSLGAFRITDPHERERAFEEIDRSIEQQFDRSPMRWLRLLVHAKSTISDEVGLVLIGLLRPAAEQAAVAADRRAIQYTLCDVGYALAEYRAKHGSFPDALGKLVPEYLEAIPLDLYTGDPLTYRLTDGGFLLYSLGQDGVDDGGRMGGDPYSDDIAFGDVPEEESE